MNEGQTLSSTSNSLIRLININKIFEKGENNIHVLKGTNLTITKGEMLGIVGISGSGKTTLLHIIGTLEKPTSGSILFQDRDISIESEEGLANFRNKTIGFVFQFHHLLPEFSALENTAMPALINGIKRKRAYEMARNTLIEVGFKDRFHHRTGELSGGEQQRVAIARAIVLNPPILLADEPTGNLDSKTGMMIHELLIDFNKKRGVTLIIVTHNESLIKEMSRTLRLEDGALKEMTDDR